MKYETDDLRIKVIKDLVAPRDLISRLAITDAVSECVYHSRKTIKDILHNKDHRLLVIAGPCSVHDTRAALEYADRLQPLIAQYQDSLHIVMRVYFEKPRTTVGWKGLINDPDLDNSFHINKGLEVARRLLLDLNARGISAATEYLDLISPQYISDLIAWGAIGARTTESQTHRELASGLSCPVGFKNGTNGNIQIAVDAMRSASQPHHFLSVTKGGHSAIFSTAGNQDCHIIMRGGGGKSNYDSDSVDYASQLLVEGKQARKLMIDFSHANSNKKYREQIIVANNVAEQLQAGERRIMGVMIESHLVEGRQDLKFNKDGTLDRQGLVYGQSITDACMGWEDTAQVLATLAAAVQAGRT
ncbi:MAG: 3-deoxy-7-phosphoheptulonate synthase [Chromatiales bacterium]|nr:3-deoxy-7-phosphoheptulonate synthase [Chromatiales bacterium]